MLKILRKATVVAALALTTALLTPPPAALAWGKQGHSISAAIAELRLSPAARQQVDRLLAGEPNPTLAGVSNWADMVRANDPELGRVSAPWHFVNLGENDCVYDPAINGNNGQNIVEALRTQTAILADRARTDAERGQALKFVVHFAGDIHQPMHAGYANDRGGNETKVRYLGRDTNLHSVWDSRLLETRNATDAAYVQRLLALPAPDLTPPNPQADPVDWAQQDCRIATRPGVYPAEPTIGEEYTREFLPVAEAQLRLAGERLGQLLNAALGG